MNFPSKTGSGRIFMDGKVLPVTWKVDKWCSYTTQVTLPNGHIIEVTDYEERFDFHYRPSDDGSEFYELFVLLDPEEPDPIAPSEDDLLKELVSGLTPIIESVAIGQTHAVDLVFCRNLFSYPECMLRKVQETGSIAAAQKLILRETFQLRV